MLRKWIVVKYDKPNSCYHFDILLRDLKKISASEFLEAIRSGKGEDHPYSAHELVWERDNRFKSVMSFRQIVNDMENKEESLAIKQGGIALLDPIKPIYGHKYSYSLQDLAKNPNRKQEYKK